MNILNEPDSGITASKNMAYEVINHRTESQVYRRSPKRGELQVVNEGVMSPTLSSAQVGPRGCGVKLVPSSHRHMPLPAEPVVIISEDGEQNGVDEETVYDVLH